MSKSTSFGGFLCTVLAVIVGCGAAIGLKQYFDKDESATSDGESSSSTELESTDSENGFSTELESTEHVQLFAVTPLMATVGSNYVSQTLKAVVYPETAENKQVDWSVAWADTSNTANVTDYVTVTPSSDGSTTATVTCYQAFTGNIVVMVTTRESGYTASCVVKFVGIPTEMNVTTELSVQDGAYHLGIGETYTFNVALDNPFHSVGADYQNVTATLHGVGEVVLCDKVGNVWQESSAKECSLDTLKDNFLTINYENGVLTVTTLKTIESYYKAVSFNGITLWYIEHFKEFVTDCYFTVTLQEELSGIEQ
ncbi:MAG: hypothetical protein IJY26_04135, partial [Clostridia bacterium]|nr:hypothetical protein [Clostridia bacterium]